MMAQRSGATVCMSSGARGDAVDGSSHQRCAYSAAKAGIQGFARDAALELAGHGARINAVTPRRIETERTAATFEDLCATSEFSPHGLVPMRRIGQPREIFDAVLFLAPDVARNITGIGSVSV